MRQEKLKASGLTITPTAAQAGHMAKRIALSATWAEQIAAGRRFPSAAAGFGKRLAKRHDTSNSIGAGAAQLGQNLTPEPIEVDMIEMSLAPFAPPLRQISAARQGAAEWRSERRPAREPRLPPWARPHSEHTPAPASPGPQLLDELAALGWGQEPT